MKNYEFIYWINNQFGGKKSPNKKWNTLIHNGVFFPEPYNKNNIPLLYKNKKVILNIEAEEYAYYYSKYLDTEYIKNPKFNKNFWSDWKKLIDKKFDITNFENCDFSFFQDFLNKEKEIKSRQSKEEKEEIKEERKKKEEKYTTALIDGKNQQVGNFRIEPPGIFLGRGCHPKLGKLKKQILPKDITINISEKVKIPEINLKGDYKWGKIIHDNTVYWLASWKDNITGKTKYVFPGEQSDFKAKSDISKFDLAKLLKKKISDIKKINNENLESKNEELRQLATALYFIDKLALRIGNEKGEDQADTVGVSSLRIEHISLIDNIKFIIKLDFLSKDSVRYINKFEVSEIVYNNLQGFIKNKKLKDDLFDLIKADDINKYLQRLMTGLTSKVFRTYNASSLFQKELNAISKKFQNYDEKDKINILLNEFNKANAKVALLCNHQKKVSKGFNNQLDKINQKIKEQKKKKKELEELKKSAKNEKAKKIRIKIKKIDNNINILKLKKNAKIEMKAVSLGTSKINYIDPRITIVFLKKNNLDINKIFTKTLQQKFYWAFNVDLNYEF